MKCLILFLLLGLAGCGATQWKTVDKVLMCTPDGGFGGAPARCRVSFTDGSRGTTVSPIAAGDSVYYSSGLDVWRLN